MKPLRLTLHTSFVLIAACLAFAGTAAAAPTDLDTTFGEAGYSWLTTESGADENVFAQGRAAELPGGGYATVDEVCFEGDCRTVVSRIDADGQPFEGFGDAGKVFIDHDTLDFHGMDLAEIQGELMVVGSAVDSEENRQKATALLNPETGELRTEYGNDGIVEFGADDGTDAYARVILPDGGPPIGLAVSLSLVTPATTFVVWNDPESTSEYDLDIGEDRRLLGQDLDVDGTDVYVSGAVLDTTAANPFVPAVVRKVAADGVDSTYGVDGVVRIEESFGLATDVKFTDDGLYVAGSAGGLDTLEGFVAKLDQGGDPKPAFGSGGIHKCTAPVDGGCGISAVDIDDQGRVLASGSVNDADDVNKTLITRLTPQGTLDPSFGGGELVVDAGLGSETAKEIFTAGDKIVFRAYGVFDDGDEGLQGAFFARLAGGGSVDPGPGPGPGPGPYPEPQPPASEPLSAAFGKLKSKQKAKKFKTFSGTANGTGLDRVQVAIQKVDAKLLKKKRCLFVKNARGALVKVKAVKGKCTAPKWLTAKGTMFWSFKLSRALKPGKYVLSARATGAGKASKPVTKRLTLIK